uniref:Retrovirus-related Pol polyprotein from transposon TNT 1-94 n=1 Tax=Tanacetum cinerariifolium TaxID=118510 RepID=A0A6L2LBE5_TANCI|nr:retrovirus-related Pol polyprotein from transposon TNT 1-94 [Tanacetum cinerariifolium]
MFKIGPSQTSMVDMVPNNQSSASIRTNPITNFQHHVTFKENVSSNTVNSSSTRLVHTARNRRPQPKGNTRNDRVPSASKSSEAKKNVIIEDHRRNLSLSKNQKTMSSERNNIKLAIWNDKSEIVCGTCKQCFVTANHDACLLSSVNALNSRANNMCANVPLVQIKRDIGYRNIKLLIKFMWTFLGTVRFGNDHIATILGYGDLKWGNITITRVYFVEGLGHNLFLVCQFCDADLEVAFRRNTCFIRDLDGVDFFKCNCSTNLYTINLYGIASASPICLMARATPTKSWLWHQRLSHLNFGTINDLAKNDLVSGLPRFKYAKEHLCPSCKQGKSKRASHPPKPVPNSKQQLHLLHMDLCGPMRFASINGKWYVLVIVDEYSRYTWVHFLRTKDETPEKIMETMNVTFDELSAMALKQNSSKPGLQSLTSGQISSGLELTYALSTITPKRPSKCDLYILFQPLHNEYLGGQPSEAPRTILAAPQGNRTPLPNASVADNVSNAVFEGDLFVNPFATPSTKSVEPSTQYVDPSNMYNFYQPYPHDYQCTKDHPLERFDDDILVVQVYVDDIIFGLTNPRYATLFSDLMKSRFEMSMIGEMTFLGLQVNQCPSGIFINQSNYMSEILKKCGLNTCDIIGTPMDIKDKLDLDQIGTPVDATKYCSMIGALMYLTSSRLDIVHATCICA